jgi:hypothetical protein
MRPHTCLMVLSAALALLAGSAAFAQAAPAASAGTAAAAQPANSQQERMKSCNADATAKGLKGDDRKSFMKSCLKGSGSDAAK